MGDIALQVLIVLLETAVWAVRNELFDATERACFLEQHFDGMRLFADCEEENHDSPFI